MGNACSGGGAAQPRPPHAAPLPPQPNSKTAGRKPQQAAVDAAPSGPPPPPLGVCFGGGGFRAFFVGLALARALHAQGLWAPVGYVSGNSGGSWLAGSFLFDGSFYRRVTDLSTPVEDVVAGLLKGYRRAAGTVERPALGAGLETLIQRLLRIVRAMDSTCDDDDEGSVSELEVLLLQAVDAQYWQVCWLPHGPAC